MSQTMSPSIESFTGRYAALSPTFRSAFFFESDSYLSAAAAFEAVKIAKRADRVSFTGWNCDKPWMARTMGKRIPAAWIRKDWAQVEDLVMLEIQRSKFSWPDLRKVLLATSNCPIIYGNTHHDNRWGQCLCRTSPPAKLKCGVGHSCTGRGQNKLGEILMRIRQEMQTAIDSPDPALARASISVDYLAARLTGREVA